MHAWVLKFHIWVPHENIAHPYSFLSELSLILELYPLEEMGMKSCQQDITKKKKKTVELGA